MADELEVIPKSPLSAVHRHAFTDPLQERLKNHARSFDSLLSLIPAKLYYGEDVSVCITSSFSSTSLLTSALGSVATQEADA